MGFMFREPILGCQSTQLRGFRLESVGLRDVEGVGSSLAQRIYIQIYIYIERERYIYIYTYIYVYISVYSDTHAIVCLKALVITRHPPCLHPSTWKRHRRSFISGI